MRKIILNLAVTLDGFIEGPNGETDWCRIDDEPTAESTFESHFDKFLARIDTIFYGRVSYDLWGNYEPGEDASLPEQKLWSGVHSKKKYVFSKSPNETDERATYISEDIASNVREIKSQPGKDIWLYGGASLTTSFINLGLVDNYLLAIYPIILGAGKPLFSEIKDRTNLTLNKIETSKSGVILLDYDRK
jgi:dihydrofolate reductase